MPSTQTDSAREARARRSLARQEYCLRKSRGRLTPGGYRILDPDANRIVTGERFDLSLADVEAWVAQPVMQ